MRVPSSGLHSKNLSPFSLLQPFGIGGVLNISRDAWPHILKTVDYEIFSLKTLHEQYGDEWFDGFDPNDVHIYESIKDSLLITNSTCDEYVELGSGKSSYFLSIILRQYVIDNIDQLDKIAFDALKAVYDQRPIAFAPFPDLK